MLILGQVPTESPKALYFAIGMGIALFFLYGLGSMKKSFSEDEKTTGVEYPDLEKQVRDSWSKASRNNRLYLGALILGFTMQKAGEIMGHPIFGSPSVISFTYLILFTSTYKHLINGKELDHQIIKSSLKGIQMERQHPEWRARFFQEFVNKNSQGSGMLSLIFFRVIVLSWILFRVIDFGIISRFADQWSPFKTSSISLAAFALIALFLWGVGCHHYYSLRTKIKEVRA